MQALLTRTSFGPCLCRRSHTSFAQVPRARGPAAFTASCFPPAVAPIKRSSIRTALRAAKATEVSAPKSAKDAVEAGLKAFESDNAAEAARLFKLATTLKPNKEEALAAYYNLGCAYTKEKEWALAVEAVMKAVNDYDMKLIVPLRDADLKPLRERREWIDRLSEMKGSLSQGAKVELRAEAKSPFRFSRIVLLGSLTAGAGLGLVIILARLISSLQGGEPDLMETVTNLGINAAAVAVLGFFLRRDLQGKERDLKVVLREEDLSRLQVSVGKERVVPLLKLRGYSRPVILAGSKTYVDRCLKSVKPYEDDLKARGVSLVPVVLDDSVTGVEGRLKALKEELKKSGKTSSGFGAIEEPKQAASSERVLDSGAEGKKPLLDRAENKPEAEPILKEKERRMRYPAYAMEEWRGWLDAQKEFAKLSPEQQNCYVQVQLDGRVRTSGLGIPNWQKIVGDLPPLDSIRTTFTDGVISDV